MVGAPCCAFKVIYFYSGPPEIFRECIARCPCANISRLNGFIHFHLVPLLTLDPIQADIGHKAKTKQKQNKKVEKLDLNDMSAHIYSKV